MRPRTGFGPKDFVQGLEPGSEPMAQSVLYPDSGKEMKNGHKEPLFGKSYLIRNHFWVNFGLKKTKIKPIFVRFGSYWMLISMVKIIFGHYLHKNGLHHG